MEFKFVIDKWERTKIKDSTQCSIVTPQNNILSIPNFIETRRRILKGRKGYRRRSGFFGNILPMIRISCPIHTLIRHYHCNLLTGKWQRTHSSPKKHYLALCHKLRKFDKECMQRKEKIKESFVNVFPKELSSIVCSYS